MQPELINSGIVRVMVSSSSWHAYDNKHPPSAHDQHLVQLCSAEAAASLKAASTVPPGITFAGSFLTIVLASTNAKLLVSLTAVDQGVLLVNITCNCSTC